MSWHTSRMCVFDTESTGTDVGTDRIVTAAVAYVGGGRPTQRPQGAPVLLDPGVEIPEKATAVHGVTTERARADGIPAADGIRWVVAALADAVEEGLPIVGMNLRYDLTLLDRECRRYHIPTLADRVTDDGLALYAIDALVLDKHIDRYRRGKRTLAALCEHYQVPHDGAHEADADAIAAARVAWRIGSVTPGLAGMGLAELHTAQIGWAAEQAASLAAYFDSKGQEHDVRPEWPVIPAGEVATP